MENKLLDIYDKINFGRERLSEDELLISKSNAYLEFEKEMNSIQSIIETEHLDDKRRYLKELENKTENIIPLKKKSPIKRKTIYSILSLAALFILLLWINISSPKNSLYELEHYPNLTQTRNDINNTQAFEDAYLFYNNKEYLKSAQAFENHLLQLSNDDLFYAGLSNIHLQKFDKGITLLNKIPAEFKRYPKEYFIIYAYAQIENFEKVKKICKSDFSHLPPKYIKLIDQICLSQ